MIEQEGGRIWKVRTVKDYPEAHNHLFIGQVLQVTESYVRLDCRTYHFGRVVNSVKDIKVGLRGIRILPWSRIEVVNELPASFDYFQAKVIANKEGRIVLHDGQAECVLAAAHDKMY